MEIFKTTNKLIILLKMLWLYFTPGDEGENENRKCYLIIKTKLNIIKMNKKINLKNYSLIYNRLIVFFFIKLYILYIDKLSGQ